MIQHLSRGVGHCYRKPRPRIEEQPTLHAQQPRRFAAARRDVSHETSRKEQCRPCETKRPPSRAVKGEGGLATAATVRPLPRNASDTSRAAIQRPRRSPRRELDDFLDRLLDNLGLGRSDLASAPPTNSFTVVLMSRYSEMVTSCWPAVLMAWPSSMRRRSTSTSVAALMASAII